VSGSQPIDKPEGCPSRADLQKWLSATETHPAPVGLGAHIADCASCQAHLDAITESHELADFRVPTAEPIQSPALDRIVSSLRNATNGTRRPTANTVAINQLSTELSAPQILHQAGQNPNRETLSEKPLELPASTSSANGVVESETLPAEIGGYEILRKLGQGGMGVVFLARDRQLRRLVAIKKLGTANGDKMARLEREAQAIAQLEHKNVVRLLSWEYEKDGSPFLTMEYVDGATLGDFFRERKEIEIKKVIELVIQAANGLTIAHQAGILHRDIKPVNILITSLQEAKLADFSLAQFLEGSSSHVTQAGVIVGTPAYMSPEQARGEQLDARSDIYSLGCVLYEGLTGAPPFQGTQIQILRQVLESDPRVIRQLNERVPVELEIICQKAMATTRENRYASASDFADDLRRFLAGEPIHARAASWGTRAWKWARRNPWQTTAASIALLAFLGAITSAVWIRSVNTNLQISHQKLRASNDRLMKAEHDAQTSFELTRKLLTRIVERMQDDLFQVPQADKLAVESVRDSAELHRRLAELRPLDEDLALDYLESLKNLWYTEWLYQNQQAEATAFEEYQKQAELLSKKFPKRIEILAIYADLLADLSMEEEKKGNQANATSLSQKAKYQLRQLQELAPDSFRVCKLAWKIAYQEYRQTQERSESKEAQLAAAQHLVSCCETCTKLAAEDDLDGELQLLCDNLCRLAEIQTSLKLLAEAKSNLHRVDELCDKFRSGGEPRMWSMVRIRSFTCRADLAIAQGEIATARESLTNAVGECRHLQSEYPDDPGIRRSLARVLYRAARMEWDHGDRPLARPPADEAIQILKSLEDEGLSRDNATELLRDLEKLDHEMQAEADRNQLSQEPPDVLNN
jgi:serine/threonine protein kinase